MDRVGRISTPLLVEFLAALSSARDGEDAIRIAIERASHSLETEVGAVLFHGRVAAALGFPAGEAPELELSQAAAGELTVLEVPGAGECHVVVAQIPGEPEGQLVLARSGEPAFTVEERHLVRGMAHMLDMTLGTLRMLEQERSLRIALLERQRMLEQISGIQRSIARREPLTQILETVTASVQELLGDVAVACELFSEGGVDHQNAALASLPDNVERETSFPVYENGVPAGRICVASGPGSRSLTPADGEVLRAFADVVSLAISNARTVQLIEEAAHDSLTGLASRQLFIERVDHALGRVTNPAHETAVLFIDLDRFKLVNDTLGHAAGDDLLIQVAHRLQETIRPCDLAARLGGDEFAVMLADGPSVQVSEAIAERILRALTRAFMVAGQEAFIDASVGIALSEADTNNAEGLIRNADIAMYASKRHGGGRHHLYSEALAKTLRSRLNIEADLRRAISNNELLLNFQPIIELSTGAITGAEALLRWQHPEHGVIPPLEFIPLAEETGLIVAIGRWVLHEGCRQAARWQTVQPDEPPLFVSVNVSTRQLEDRQLPEDITSALTAGGLAPRLLTLEITETMLLHQYEPAVSTLELLRKDGVSIAIDDFGTGYASLTNLHELPIDTLKIDRSFLAGSRDDSAAVTFTRSIVSFARTLNLRTIAEGIENEDKLAILLEANCDLGQGYYFARPMAADQFVTWLRARGSASHGRFTAQDASAVEIS